MANTPSLKDSGRPVWNPRRCGPCGGSMLVIARSQSQSKAAPRNARGCVARESPALEAPAKDAYGR